MNAGASFIHHSSPRLSTTGLSGGAGGTMRFRHIEELLRYIVVCHMLLPICECEAPGRLTHAGGGPIFCCASQTPTHRLPRICDGSFDYGKPISRATVEVHQARGAKDQWCGKTYVQEPDMTLTTDKDGAIVLPRCPFGDKVKHDYGWANSVLLYVVNRNGTIRTAFHEASDFNLEYFRGHKDNGQYEITLDM